MLLRPSNSSTEGLMQQLGGRPEDNIALLQKFLFRFTHDRLGFYWAIKDDIRTEGVKKGMAYRPKIYKVADAQYADLSRVDSNIDWGQLGLAGFYALAVVRVHICIRWAGEVMKRYPAEFGDNNEVLYPQFQTSNRLG